MFKRILVPLDGSERAERALPVAARLARASGATVVLLRVVSLTWGVIPYQAASPMTSQAIIDADLEEAKNYLDRIIHADSLMNVPTEIEVIVAWQPPAFSQ